MTRTPAIFDANNLGASLTLERGDTVLTYTASANINRLCRLTQPKDYGRWRASFYLWGDASISNAVSIGIVKASTALTTYPGGDANSYGYRPAEGAIYNNGSSVQSVTVGAKEQVIDVEIDLDDSAARTVTWRLNGVVLHTQSLPNDSDAWYLAATVSGSTGYDLRIMAVAGQRGAPDYDSEFPWWTGERTALQALRVARKPCVTSESDDPALSRYEGLLLPQSKLSLRRGVRAWPMRASTGGVGMGGGTLKLANVNGALDYLVEGDPSRARVNLAMVNDPVEGVIDYSTASPLDTLEISSIAATSDSEIEIRLTDPLRRLSQSLYRRMAPPYADDSIADKPLGWLLGVGRSLKAALMKAATLTYDFAGRAVGQIGTVRDGGYPYDPDSGPPDPYTLNPDGTITMDGPPVYTLTLDASTIGGELGMSPTNLIPATTGAGKWDDVLNATFGTDTITLSWDRSSPSPGPANDSDYVRAYVHLDEFLEAGKTYRLTFTVNSISQFTGVDVRIPTGDLILTGRNPQGYTTFIDASAGAVPKTNVTVSGDFTVTQTNRGLQIMMIDGQIISNIDVHSCVIDEDSITLYEVPPDPAVDDDDLTPITLQAALVEIFERHLGLSRDQWDYDKAGEIDAETGYAGIGLYAAAGETVTIEAALRAALDAYCCDIYRDRSGVYRIWRLRDRSGDTPTVTITRADCITEPRVSRHRAPGLTTQARIRRNWQPLGGSMSTDTVTLTPDVRAKLADDYRMGITSSVPLASYYASDAAGREPKGFALDRRDDGQQSLDYADGYYTDDHFECEVRVPFSLVYDIGVLASFDYLDVSGRRRYFSAVRNMEIIEIFDEDPIGGTVGLILLG